MTEKLDTPVPAWIDDCDVLHVRLPLTGHHAVEIHMPGGKYRLNNDAGVLVVYETSGRAVSIEPRAANSFHVKGTR